MSSWRIRFKRFDPEHEGTREALCTLGNGYFATRGAAEFARADAVHYPGTYLAGCYNRLVSEVAGRQVENEDLVNVPNWLAVNFRIDGGEWFRLDEVELLDFCQDLDLRHGLLLRRIRFRDTAGRITRYHSERLVHMAQPHLAAMRVRIQAENWSGKIEFASALDGRVTNSGVARYRGLDGHHLNPLGSRVNEAGTLLLEVETRQSHIRIAQAARTRVFADGTPLALQRRHHASDGLAEERYTVPIEAGAAVTLEKVVAVYSSRDRAISAPLLDAENAVLGAPDYAQLRRSHALAWAQLWRRFDLNLTAQCPGEPANTMRLLRLHLFHLLQVASPNVQHVDAGVPARGLHGEAYRGHVFWDELFILPTLTFHMPEITLALLMYRWYRLDAARQAAREAGFRGAMYPWQSGSNGREETQRLHLNPRSGRWLPDNSHRQRHVGLAIAYNIWHYYQTTGDHEFLAAYGAEMLLEIARFFASRAEWNQASGRYEIRGVMGPDEYHEGYPDDPQPRGIDNNAYTNVMASWTLRRARDVLNALSEERRAALCAQLKLDSAELAHWDECSRLLRVDFHDDHIISQFEGYTKLAEFDWQGYRRRYGNIDRLDRILEAEGDTTNRYRLSKQADVLMLFYLLSAEELEDAFRHLGYTFRREWIPKNVAYYHARTSHGSSLSHVVHAWVLSRTQRRGSWELFQDTLRVDFEDMQGGTTREGIHLGAMAGSIDLMFRCYTGLEVRDDMLWLKPRLPEQIQRFCMHVHFRGRALRLTIDRDEVRIVFSGREASRIGVRDRVYRIEPGRTYTFAIPAAAGPLAEA